MSVNKPAPDEGLYLISNFLVAALLAGLAGGLHCASMCGGVIAAVASSASPPARTVIPVRAVPPRLRVLLAWNLGRVTTYMLLGALVGSVGSSVLLLSHLVPVERVLFAAAHLFMTAVGLYLLGWLPALSRLEVAGGAVWRRVQPLAARVLPANTPSRAALMGLFWGLVPCGMVYTMLLSALLSGSAFNGLMVMLAFGVGTLPNVLGLTLLAARGRRLLQSGWLRKLGGSIVVGLGLLGVYHATLPGQGVLSTLCITPLTH